MQTLLAFLNTLLDPWTLFGLFGQTLFMTRFIVQWIASERAKQSIMPDMFWYLSLGGGIIVLIYALHKHEPVFILGQLPGVIVYARNLYFIHKKRGAPNAG